MKKTMQAPGSVQNNPGDESEDIIRFDKSLQELRDLGSQLHYAANYCESAYIKTKEKETVVENTREYICRAMVTVVDHIGNVSANLDFRVTNFSRFSKAELQINSLNQKLSSSEEYANKLPLTRLRWNPILPKYSSRYLITRSGSGSNEAYNISPSGDAKKELLEVNEEHGEFDTEEDAPLFSHTETKGPCLAKNLTIRGTPGRKSSISSEVPVHDGLSIPSTSRNPMFDFQATKKIGRNIPSGKSAHGSNIFSLIRRVKRTT